MSEQGAPTGREGQSPRATRPPASGFMKFLRYWLPVLIIAVGVVFAAARGFDELGIEGLVAFIAAGSSVWFMNFLMRIGLRGEVDRDREEEARRYMEKHGRWPDDPPPPTPQV